MKTSIEIANLKKKEIDLDLDEKSCAETLRLSPPRRRGKPEQKLDIF